MVRLPVVVLILSALVTQEQKPFRTSVDLVQVDVVVTDERDRPVRGLAQDDFELLVEGKPVAITGFDAVSLPESAAVGAPRRAEPSGAVLAANDEPMDGRILVLVLDDIFMGFDARRIYRTKQIARDIFARLAPGDRLAMLTAGGAARTRVEFTNDSARLEEALAGFFPSDETLADAPADVKAERFLINLRKVVRSLRDVPHRRKGLIVIGEASMFVVGGYPGNPNNTGAETVLAYRELLQEAARANVAVYSFSAGEMDMHPLGSYTLRYISEDTGGRSWVNMNAHLPGVEAMYAETGNYYLLGFQPPDWKDEKFRKIEVKVRRPGVRVRARRGFETMSATQASATDATDRLLALPLATPTLPIRLSAVPVPSAGPETPVLTVVEVSGAGMASAKHLDLRVVALDRDGRVRARDQYRGGITVEPDPMRWMRIAGRLELQPGWYQLRIGVTAGDAGGSLVTELEVPRADAAIQVGGLVLGTAPNGVARAALIQLWLPVAPIAAREFPARLRAAAALRLLVVDPSADETIQLRGDLLQDGLPARSLKEESLPASHFRGKGDAAVFAVPEDLEPGAYSLRVTVNYRGKEHQRELAFRIVP